MRNNTRRLRARAAKQRQVKRQEMFQRRVIEKRQEREQAIEGIHFKCFSPARDYVSEADVV